MKTSTILSVIASAGIAHAQWWAGAPDCAHGCFSSYWSSSSAWPAATSYCQATQGASVSSCISSACQATPTAHVSYSSLSSSLCSRWSSCSTAGSTGVYTVTAPAFTGDWHGPGRYGDDDHDWDDDRDWDDDGNDDRSEWQQWTRTWSGGVYTVTGCEWNGNPWAGGPGGWGAGGGAGSPWGPWGSGWKWSTLTQTVTQVLTVTSEGGTVTSTSVGVAVVAQAVSGDLTSTSVVAAVETTAGASGSGGGSSSTGGSAAADGRSGTLAVKAMGAVLGAVVVIAALL